MERAQDMRASADGQVAALIAQVRALAAQNDALAKENAKLASDMADLTARSAEAVSALKAQLAEAHAAIDSMIEQIKLSAQHRFGSSSEKVIPEQLPLSNEVEATAKPDAAEPDIEEALPKKSRKRGGKTTIDYSKFEILVIDHEIPAGERACPECGCVLSEMKVEVTRRVGLVLDCSARYDVPVYVFEYHETRRKGVAQEFLAGWSDALTTDGYKSYFNLGNPNIANTACLVHMRRYFAQIVKIAGGDAKAASAASVALEARRRIDAMFKADSKFDDMEPGARKAARDAELRPLMEDFGGWARPQLPLASPKLALHRALQYAVEFWPYVMNVLEDGHLELSNNAEEGL